MAVFLELRGVNVKFLFSNRKKSTSLRGTASFDVLRVKIGSGPLAVEHWKNPQKKPSKHFDAQFRAYGGKETPRGIVTKFCM